MSDTLDDWTEQGTISVIAIMLSLQPFRSIIWGRHDLAIITHVIPSNSRCCQLCVAALYESAASRRLLLTGYDIFLRSAPDLSETSTIG